MILEYLDIVDWCLLGILALLFLVQLWIYARFMAAPARRLRKERKSPITRNEVNRALVAENNQSPIAEGVSVILCAHNEAYNLSQYLQVLLTQDYPQYEVIVVDDGSEDDTRNVIEQYMVHDARLRRTFVPIGARIRSTRQLALTLAAKAAKYDYLLLIGADCVPESTHWISAMMSGFGDVQGDNVQGTKDVVLGLNAYFAETGHMNRLIRYDAFFHSLEHLGSTLCGHPRKGDSRNMAFRKSLFFDSACLAHYIPTCANTTAVVARDAITWSQATKTMKDWVLEKQWELSTESVTRCLFYVMTIALLAWYQWSVVSLAVLGLFLFRWILQTAILNISARRMGIKRFSMFSILWFDITLPLLSIIMIYRKSK